MYNCDQYPKEFLECMENGSNWLVTHNNITYKTEILADITNPTNKHEVSYLFKIGLIDIKKPMEGLKYYTIKSVSMVESENGIIIFNIKSDYANLPIISTKVTPIVPVMKEEESNTGSGLTEEEKQEITNKFTEIFNVLNTKSDLVYVDDEIVKVKDIFTNYVTKDELDDAVFGNIDTSNFATKEDLKNITIDTSNFATKDDLKNVTVDTSDLVTKEELKDKNYITKDDINLDDLDMSKFVSKEELDKKGYDTIVDVDAKIVNSETKISTEVDTKITNSETKLTTELSDLMDTKIEALDIDSYVKSELLTTEYYTKEELDKKFDNLPTGGGGGSFTSTTPVPNALGGIKKGTTFDNVPLDKVIRQLLYPTVMPNISLFNVTPTTLELGQTLNNITVKWNILNVDSIKPKSINITYYGTVLDKELANSGTKTYTLTDKFDRPMTRDISISVTEVTTGEVVTKTATISWTRDIYYGCLDATSITDVAGLTKIVNNSANRTYNFPAGGYKYLVIPTTLTKPTKFVDADTNFDVSMIEQANITVTNPHKVAVTYYVYRSANKLNGKLNMTVK